MAPKIVGALLLGGTFYRAGDEAAFAEAMRGRDYAPLIDAGHLQGAWPDLGEAEPKRPAKPPTTKSK